ncbi:MAG TPA: hypothetical protein VFC67_26690 [Prolixibacteraceae bacterium]|nr:hypothetical protein [Prolixibacteraceae bacterium]
MPAKREYTKETIEIMNRFYEAVSVLILHKKIRGIQTYCTLASIDRRHFYAQKKEISRGWFQMAWMLPLIKEFGLSIRLASFRKREYVCDKIGTKTT